MEFNELIQDRFSCRALSDREIPHEALDRILEAARVAPTAVNKQPFKIWAVERPRGAGKTRRNDELHLRCRRLPRGRRKGGRGMGASIRRA